MQWVLAVRETVVIKPSRINIVAQALYLLFPPPFPSLTLIHTPLFGWALIRLQASGLAESITRKKLVAQHLHFTHIVNDFELPLTQISRSRKYLTLNMALTIQNRHYIYTDNGYLVRTSPYSSV